MFLYFEDFPASYSIEEWQRMRKTFPHMILL